MNLYSIIYTLYALWCQAQQESSQVPLVKVLQHNHHLQHALVQVNTTESEYIISTFWHAKILYNLLSTSIEAPPLVHP